MAVTCQPDDKPVDRTCSIAWVPGRTSATRMAPPSPRHNTIPSSPGRENVSKTSVLPLVLVDSTSGWACRPPRLRRGGAAQHLILRKPWDINRTRGGRHSWERTHDRTCPSARGALRALQLLRLPAPRPQRFSGVTRPVGRRPPHSSQPSVASRPCTRALLHTQRANIMHVNVPTTRSTCTAVDLATAVVGTTCF